MLFANNPASLYKAASAFFLWHVVFFLGDCFDQRLFLLSRNDAAKSDNVTAKASENSSGPEAVSTRLFIAG